MTYDLGGKLTGIDATGTANDATFSFDALGRSWQRNLTGSTDTYSFVGTTETVARISNSSGPVITDSIVDVAGDRLGRRDRGRPGQLEIPGPAIGPLATARPVLGP